MGTVDLAPAPTGTGTGTGTGTLARTLAHWHTGTDSALLSASSASSQILSSAQRCTRGTLLAPPRRCVALDLPSHRRSCPACSPRESPNVFHAVRVRPSTIATTTTTTRTRTTTSSPHIRPAAILGRCPSLPPSPCLPTSRARPPSLARPHAQQISGVYSHPSRQPPVLGVSCSVPQPARARHAAYLGTNGLHLAATLTHVRPIDSVCSSSGLNSIPDAYRDSQCLNRVPEHHAPPNPSRPKLLPQPSARRFEPALHCVQPTSACQVVHYRPRPICSAVGVCGDLHAWCVLPFPISDVDFSACFVYRT